jgi:hypothetical protein
MLSVLIDLGVRQDKRSFGTNSHRYRLQDFWNVMSMIQLLRKREKETMEETTVKMGKFDLLYRKVMIQRISGLVVRDGLRCLPFLKHR